VTWDFGDFLWAMLVFFFWFTVTWMFISVFADILRRHDLGGWTKAGWIFLIVVLPLLGILIYVIFRPKLTPQDLRLAAEGMARQRHGTGYSAADEIAKAATLHEEGRISAEEFERLKTQALAT
jgi:predicted membrane channel-forming protein YqfA (hemolysin III family)